jgi:splicing factor 3B subunit 2
MSEPDIDILALLARKKAALAALAVSNTPEVAQTATAPAAAAVKSVPAPAEAGNVSSAAAAKRAQRRKRAKESKAEISAAAARWREQSMVRTDAFQQLVQLNAAGDADDNEEDEEAAIDGAPRKRFAPARAGPARGDDDDEEEQANSARARPEYEDTRDYDADGADHGFHATDMLDDDDNGDDVDDGGVARSSAPKPPSNRQRKAAVRVPVSVLKQLAERPELVEAHDATAADPKLLVTLKCQPHSVPVPTHWAQKRRYLEAKRGWEKAAFVLPQFIADTGISEMRGGTDTDVKSLRKEMRERARPKANKLAIDFQVLHDAFFVHQTKPRLTGHGDVYWEGKEQEQSFKDKRPGFMSYALRRALGMARGVEGAEDLEQAAAAPPPWLAAMQAYGPPPAYPRLAVPGVNAPLPPGARWGFGEGEWGRPPVAAPTASAPARALWGGDVYGPPVMPTQFAREIEARRAAEAAAASESGEDPAAAAAAVLGTAPTLVHGAAPATVRVRSGARVPLFGVITDPAGAELFDGADDGFAYADADAAAAEEETAAQAAASEAEAAAAEAEAVLARAQQQQQFEQTAAAAVAVLRPDYVSTGPVELEQRAVSVGSSKFATSFEYVMPGQEQQQGGAAAAAAAAEAKKKADDAAAAAALQQQQQQKPAKLNIF